MKDFLQRFMYGRYGMDGLNRFLFSLYFVSTILYLFTRIYGFYGLSIVILVLLVFRMFSKNVYRRAAENQKFLKFFAPVKKKFNSYKTRYSQRDTHCFFKCPGCRQTIRVPKGKGNIQIRCPKCGKQFIKTT